MLNLKYRIGFKKITKSDSYIHAIVLQWKVEYKYNISKPYACQYNVKTKLHGNV